MERVFQYVEQDGDDPLVKQKTSTEILAEFYPWWKAKMQELQRDALISEETCIADWVVTHWAWEVES